MNSSNHSIDSTVGSDAWHEGSNHKKEELRNGTGSEQSKRKNNGPIRKLQEKYHRIIAKLEAGFGRWNPKTQEIIQILYELGVLGFVVYYSINGTVNLMHGKYKSLSVLILFLELMYFRYKRVSTAPRRFRRLAVLAFTIFVYCLLMKTNLIDTYTGTATASK